jgi:cardiolipin synthase (CMP-forming)
MINVISVSLCINGTLPVALVSLFMIRDVALVYGTYAFVRDSTKEGDNILDPTTTPLKVNPTMLSKINTGLQFATISIGVGIEPLTALYPNVVPDILTSLCWITGTTTILSGFSYSVYSAFSDSGNKARRHSQALQQSVKAIIEKTKAKITVRK